MSETLPNFNCSVKKMKKISDESIRFFPERIELDRGEGYRFDHVKTKKWT